MDKYHKINSIFKRHNKTNRFIMNDWAQDEFGYLQNNIWEFTEKVDGTNIRMGYDATTGEVKYGGRTDNAQIPTALLDVLLAKFGDTVFQRAFPELESTVTIYGEGYGHKIQRGGKYGLGHGVCDFVLFDVKIGDFWLKRDDVDNIALKMGIKSVPVIGQGTLLDAINIVKNGLISKWGDFECEGIVARPIIELYKRNGNRVIAKIKGKDFKEL